MFTKFNVVIKVIPIIYNTNVNVTNLIFAFFVYIE